MRALLIGNGINRIENRNDVSWHGILASLAGTIEVPTESEGKSLPLWFEEMVLRNHPSLREIDLKARFAEAILELGDTRLHRELLAIGWDHVMTTNYDYSLEAASHPDGWDAPDRLVDENRFSLFRYNHGHQDAPIWHIHGECDVHNSLLLGSNQYMAYSHAIRNYVLTGLSYSSIRNARLSLENDEVVTWIDVLYKADVDIIGIGMGFEEMHLWWLLTDRARRMNRGEVENRIRYFEPYWSCDPARADLFDACNVDVISVHTRNRDYAGFYRKAMKTMGGASTT